MRVVGIDGSPAGGGRTAAAVRAVLAGAAERGAETDLLSLSERDVGVVPPELEGGDAFVFGSPAYRASMATPLKGLFDALPRGMWGETTAPVTGRAVAIVMTGASWHHFLALDQLRSVLSGFFCAHVVPPGLYVPTDGFDDGGSLTQPFAELADLQGQATVELATSLGTASALAALRPQA